MVKLSETSLLANKSQGKASHTSNIGSHWRQLVLCNSMYCKGGLACLQVELGKRKEPEGSLPPPPRLGPQPPQPSSLPPPVMRPTPAAPAGPQAVGAPQSLPPPPVWLQHQPSCALAFGIWGTARGRAHWRWTRGRRAQWMGHACFTKPSCQ